MSQPSPRRRRTTVQARRLRRSGVVLGPARVIHPTLRALACPWQYDHQLDGYLVPIQRLDDVLADLERRGHGVAEAAA